jgi:hypothetical protein
LFCISRNVYSELTSNTGEIEISFEGQPEQKQEKTRIFAISQEKISNDIKLANSTSEAIGATFENLVRAELDSTRTETEEQKNIRELVEEMYSKVDLLVGNNISTQESKPDGISIGFEGHKLVIKEIIEIKSSADALEHGLYKDQPLGTIESLQALVNIINDILAGKENKDIPPRNEKYEQKEVSKRNAELNKLRNRLEKFKKKNPDFSKLVFSANLSYTVYIPNSEKIYGRDNNLIEERYGYPIEFQIKKSIFSHSEVVDIAEMYIEQQSR